MYEVLDQDATDGAAGANYRPERGFRDTVLGMSSPKALARGGAEEEEEVEVLVNGGQGRGAGKGPAVHDLSGEADGELEVVEYLGEQEEDVVLMNSPSPVPEGAADEVGVGSESAMEVQEVEVVKRKRDDENNGGGAGVGNGSVESPARPAKAGRGEKKGSPGKAVRSTSSPARVTRNGGPATRTMNGGAGHLPHLHDGGEGGHVG